MIMREGPHPEYLDNRDPYYWVCGKNFQHAPSNKMLDCVCVWAAHANNRKWLANWVAKAVV